jgi:hypothetical protein
MGILAALALALIISFIFSTSNRSKESSVAPIIVMFFILLLAGISVQYWVTPFGPLLWGVAWLPLIITLTIFTLLLITPSPYQRRTNSENAEKEAASAALSIYVWILIALLIIVALTGYFRQPT